MTGAPAPAATGTRVSFVIINKDDRGVAETLEALRAILERTSVAGEIVVVDASEGRLDDVRDRFPEVRWLPFTSPAGQVTIAAQRNVGVRASSGEVIVFIDASCTPDDGWFERLLAPIEDEGEQIVAGSCRSAGAPGLRDQAAVRTGEREYVDEAATINLAVRRAVFDRIGTFDEGFDYGSDVDLAWRASDAGFRIRYVPEAVVAHDFGSTRSEIRRSFRYGAARLRLYAKHASRRRTVLRRDPAAVVYPLYLLLLPIARRYPLYLALLAIPLVKNARHRPLLTVGHHLVYSAGILREVARMASRRRG